MVRVYASVIELIRYRGNLGHYDKVAENDLESSVQVLNMAYTKAPNIIVH